jgi:hypothetical protein
MARGLHDYDAAQPVLFLSCNCRGVKTERGVRDGGVKKPPPKWAHFAGGKLQSIGEMGS